MTKVLNVDDLEGSIDKVITIKGVDYAMKPFSVEDFLNQMRELNALGEKGVDGAEMFEMSLRMIERAFPTLPKGTLQTLNTFQVDAIYNFLKATSEEEVESNIPQPPAEDSQGNA